MNTVVISLGGSNIVPDASNPTWVDVGYLGKLKELLIHYTNSHRFVLIVGGGARARYYQNELRKKKPDASQEELDWAGIKATHENGEEVRRFLGDMAEGHLAIEYHEAVPFSKQVLVGAGWKPGHSTDYDAVEAAALYHGDTVINISNTEFLYDTDPKTHPEAKKIEKCTWDQLQEIVGHEWSPGAHKPFDPIATAKGKELGLKLILMGKNLENLRKYLDGKDFMGTIIEKKKN